MKIKTSIPIDNEIWMELKNLALQRGKDINSILKDAIKMSFFRFRQILNEIF